MPPPTTARPERRAAPVCSLWWRLALLVAACLLAFAAAIQGWVITPTNGRLVDARLETAVNQARAESLLRLQEIEGQLRSGRFRAPAAASQPDDASGPTGLAAGLANADPAITAVHRLDQDGQGFTLRRDTHGWRPAQPPHDAIAPDARPAQPWLTTALKARGDEPVGWSPPHPLPNTSETGVTVFTRWLGHDGRLQVLAFELALGPLLQPATDTRLGEHGGSIALDNEGRVIARPQAHSPAVLPGVLLQPPGERATHLPRPGPAGKAGARQRESNTESDMLSFEHDNETWQARFAPLDVGEQRWWIVGFARQADFTLQDPQARAGVPALLLALAALAAFITHRLAARLTDGRDNVRVGVQVDISDPQSADREAHSAEETCRRILQPSPVAVVINRSGGPPLFANSRANGQLHEPTAAPQLHETIAVALPPRASTALTPPAETRPVRPTPLDRLRILLVEDNAIDQLIARGLLEQLGAMVTTADHGRLALDTLEAAGPDAFDLVLMDIQMPVMDGLEAARQIRLNTHLQHLPIVAMTAHATAGQSLQCREAGLNDYIAKPILPDPLTETILRHTRQRTLTRPATPPAGHPGLPRIEGLDTCGGLRRCSGNAELYLRLLARFVSGQAGTLASIDAALAGGNHREAEQFAHTLHGTAANLGADALRQAARDLETALRNGRPSADARDRLARECETLSRGLAGALPVPATAPPAAAVADAGALEAAIAHLAALLADADGAAPDAFRAIQPALTTRLGLSIVTKISEALDHYDYDQALEYLHPQKPTTPTRPQDKP